MNLPDLLPFFDNWVRTGQGQFKAACPLPRHEDSTPSVSISQDVVTGNILMRCFGCDAKAPEIVQALGLRVSDLFGDPGHPAAIQQVVQVDKASDEAVNLLSDYTVITRDKVDLAKDYLMTRFNLTTDEAYGLSLGVDPGDSSINRPQSCAAFNSGTPHLIIPFKDPEGSLVGMQGRRLIPGDPRWRSASGSGWSKIGCFGWNLNGPIIITEGPSDALSVVGHAKFPAIAVRGASNTSDDVLDQIKKWIHGRQAIVIGDNGAAGEKFAETISQGIGIPRWVLPPDYGDLCDYLADSGSLEHLLEAELPEPKKSPAEIAAELVTRIADDIENAIYDDDLMNDLNCLPTEEQQNILARVARRAPHGQIGDYRGFIRTIQSRIAAMPPPGGDNNGNNAGVGGGGNPLPNQPVIMWNQADQLHVTEDNVRSAMDHYEGDEFYQASPGQYVKVVDDDLINLKDAGLKSMLSQMGHWRVINGQQERGHVPPEAAKMVSDPSWQCGIPIIKRRVEVPFMLTDGSIIAESGFHENSGIYLLPRSNDPIVVPQVPASVTDQDVAKALSILEDAVEGFNFENKASKANLIAMTLTSPLRELFKESPMVPLLTSTAPQSGSGKGTSVRVPLSTVGIGTYSLSTTAYNSDENEFEKKLVAKLLKKSTYIFLDNIRSTVNSAVMEQMLTAANYDGRTLGFSDVNSLSTLVLWVCTLQSTGSFNRDLTRRCVPVELRKNWQASWKHKNIEAYLADKRGELIWACFVAARKWDQEGRPKSNVRLDGYGGWTETIGGILEHVLKYEGFLNNLESFRQKQDEVATTLDSILERWLENNGEEAHPARMAVEEMDDPFLHRLLGLHGNPSPRQVLNALERQLTSQRGHVISNTHMWFPVGSGVYGHEGVKKLFRCVPLDEIEEFEEE